MLKECGNLIKDNIEITKELLDFAKANDYKISLRTGDYCKVTSNMFNGNNFNRRFNRSMGDNIELLTAVNVLYLRGDCFLPDYYDVIGFTNYEQIIALFRKLELPVLGMKKTREVYRSRIDSKIKKNNIQKYGVDSPMKLDSVKKKQQETCLRIYGVANASQSPIIKDKIRNTNIERYGGYSLQVPKLRAKMEKTQLERYGEVQNLGSSRHRKKFEETMMERYQAINPSNSPELYERRRLIFQQKYDADSPFESTEIQNKIKETLKQKYDVINPSQIPDVKEKVKETSERKYGGIGFASPVTNEKIKKTNLKLYGSECAMKCREVKDTLYNTFLERYDENNPMRVPDIVRKNQNTRASKDDRYAKILEIRDGIITDKNEIIEILSNFCETSYYLYMNEFGLLDDNFSGPEMFMKSILDDLNPNYEHNARSSHQVRNENGAIIELDFYYPEFNLGIEVNGLGVHSVNIAAKGEPKTKDYHFRKFQAFHKSGILMLSFTDYELYKFKDDVVNIIKHHLKLLEAIHVSETVTVTEDFLKFNEIKSLNESLNYGLFDKTHLSEDFEDHQHQRFIHEFEYWDCGVIRA